MLTGKTYNAFPKSDRAFDQVGDYDFFRAVFPNLPSTRLSSYIITNSSANSKVLEPGIPISLGARDERVAGAITTPRFLTRYTTTVTNKNRRRAAAVFRIFLCDPMFPIIPPPPDKKAASLNSSFSDDIHGEAVTEDQLRAKIASSDSQRHGSDKRCAACHYKLDPMGKTFQNLGLYLNPEPSGGALTYAHPDGTKFSQKVDGIGSLGQEITKQPEYENCQVDWFWKRYIGTDVPLLPSRKAELIEKFNSIGRRTNDFIQYLVSSPEFRVRPQTSEEVSFTTVRPLLQRCDNCHYSEFSIPTFANGKLGGKTLQAMQRRLNLPDGSKDKMPRDWAKWDERDLAIVKAWINQGAKDSEGQSMLSADQSQEKQ